jgi:hypothetical protein
METANKPLLNDPLIFPDDQVLKNRLKESFEAYDELITYCLDKANGFIPEWRYYKDGNAWLCKVSHKKKTICWLSVWDGYFKTGFYFTEKHVEAINNLPIDESVKVQFNENRPIGKLLPLSFAISYVGQLTDLKTVIQFKSKLK